MKARTASPPRSWTALSTLLVGSAMALWLEGGDLDALWAAWDRALSGDSLHAAGITLALMLVGTLLAWSSAGLITIILESGGGRLMKTGFWFGKAVVFFPVHALAWAFLGLWIGQQGHPVWSLTPVIEPVETLSWQEQWARFLWTWTPALGLLLVPLTAQWLCLLLQRKHGHSIPVADLDLSGRNVSTPHLASPQREPGQRPGPSLIAWHETTPLRLPGRGGNSLLPPPERSHGAWSAGLLALLLLIGVEDILAIHGSGAALARSLRAHDLTSAAPVVLMLSCIAAFWSLLAGCPKPWHMQTNGQMLGAVLKLAAWSLPVLSFITSATGTAFPLLPVIDAEAAFASPSAALLAGLTPMLCALSLWLAGHIITTRNES